MKMNLQEAISRNQHNKTDVRAGRITSFKRFMEEFDKAWGLKPL